MALYTDPNATIRIIPLAPNTPITRAEFERLIRDNHDQREAHLMMARALDRMADSYEHLAERLTAYPVEHTAYPTETNTIEDI